MSEHDLELTGCRAEPLSSYLKSLGVLRLVAEQKDPGARGYWVEDTFHIQTSLSEDELVGFFRDEYCPTPILDPWNGGSGFWDTTTANTTLQRLSECDNPRFGPYRETITKAWEVLQTLRIKHKPSKEEKIAILRLCRNHLPDAAIEWLDTAYVLTVDKPRYAPMLGTGGNDGKLDFANNFMQHVLRVVMGGQTLEVGARKPKQHENLDLPTQQLKTALFGGDVVLTDSAVGQFFPGGVGGPNGVQGFEAPSLVNSWDFVLMIEGVLFFAGSVSRRLGGQRGVAAFPFTVSASTAGWGTLTESGENARAEIWLPTWGSPAAKNELLRFFAEGRAEIGRRQAQNGTDFARAAASLGVDRGVSGFYRCGLLRRSGKAHLAAPLGRVRVEQQKEVDLLQRADAWLSRFRRLALNDESPASVRQAFKRIEQAIFAYCTQGGSRNLQSVLRAMGAAERVLANSRKMQKEVPPLQGLALEWLRACNDGSPEFRIAAALASINHPKVGSIRTNLEPVVKGRNEWAWSSGNAETVREADLCRSLVAILERRVLSAEKLGGERQENPEEAWTDARTSLPIKGRIHARASDLVAFLSGAVDDTRVSELLWGLCALDWDDRHGYRPLTSEKMGEVGLSRLYAVIKLVFWPGEIRVSSESEPIVIHAEKAIINRLRSGDVEAATQIAVQRLRSSGLQVIGDRQPGSGNLGFIASPQERLRIGAALLVPIEDLRVLMKLTLRMKTKSIKGGIA